jgi:hypothetical protein
MKNRAIKPLAALIDEEVPRLRRQISPTLSKTARPKFPAE